MLPARFAKANCVCLPVKPNNLIKGVGFEEARVSASIGTQTAQKLTELVEKPCQLYREPRWMVVALDQASHLALS